MVTDQANDSYTHNDKLLLCCYSCKLLATVLNHQSIKVNANLSHPVNSEKKIIDIIFFVYVLIKNEK